MKYNRIQLPSKQIDDAFTGERYIPSVKGEIAWEHLHRYCAALDLCLDADVLDIASGEGYGSYMLAQSARTVVGVDRDAPTIRQAKKRYERENLRFLEGSCNAIPCTETSFDVVVSFETIEHIEEPHTFLREIRRVLRPGGILLLSSPDRDAYNPEGKEQNEFHLNEMTEQELLSVLCENFRHVSLARQSSLYGSLIIPNDSQSLPPALFLEKKGELARPEHLPDAPYVIALCTDRETGAKLPASFFHSGLPSTYLSALHAGIDERDSRIRAYVAEDAASKERIAALEGGIKERDDRIWELIHKDIESQRLIGALQGGVQERDEKIRALLAQDFETQSTLSALQGGIEARDDKIWALAAKEADLQKVIAQLRSEIEERDNRISSLLGAK